MNPVSAGDGSVAGRVPPFVVGIFSGVAPGEMNERARGRVAVATGDRFFALEFT